MGTLILPVVHLSYLPPDDVLNHLSIQAWHLL